MKEKLLINGSGEEWKVGRDKGDDEIQMRVLLYYSQLNLA